MFNVFHLTILNLIIVSKINLHWSCLLSPTLLAKIGMTLNEKPIIKTPSRSVWNVLVFWSSKNKCFCVCDNIPYTVSIIICETSQPIWKPYFKLFFQFCLSYFQPHTNEVNTFPVCIKEEIL